MKYAKSRRLLNQQFHGERQTQGWKNDVTQNVVAANGIYELT